MELHLPTLMLCATLVAAVGAGAVSVAGRVQAVYRGHPWWEAAQWAVVLGLGLHMMGQGLPGLEAPAHLLLLWWPIGLLLGLRQFDARTPLPWSPRTDLGVAAACGLATTVNDVLWPASTMTGFTLVAVLLNGYAATALFTARGTLARRTVRRFAMLFAAVAAALLARWAWAVMAGNQATQDPAQAHALTFAVAASVFAHLTLHAGYVRNARELRESRRRLRLLANTDMLTRVPNRRHFQELAQRALARAEPGSAAVVMFDIDHFKQINDVMGHAAGDRALRLVSRCMQDVLRQQDVAGRYGGDEFALLLPRTRAEDAMGVAARIVARVHASSNGRPEPQQIPRVSLSFGVVQMMAGESVDDALRRADQALYEAKRQGRSRAVLAEGDEERPVFTESQRLGLTPQ